MNAKLQRKINVLRMYTELKTFNYKPPEMSYDKATGDVTIKDFQDEKKERRIIKDMDEVREMKQQLFKEAQLEEGFMEKDPGMTEEQMAERIKVLREDSFRDSEEYDPNLFY